MTDLAQDSEGPSETIGAAFRRYMRALKEKPDAEQRLRENHDASDREAGHVFDEGVGNLNRIIRSIKELEASADEEVGRLVPLRDRRWEVPEAILHDGVPQERLDTLLHDCEVAATELAQAAHEHVRAKKREEARRRRIVFLIVLAIGVTLLLVLIKLGTISGGEQGASTPAVERPAISKAASTDRPEPSVAPSLTPTPLQNTYVVQSGDTLASIAARFGTTYQTIMELNGLTSTTIFSGTHLLIPSPGDTESSIPAPVRGGRIAFVSDRDGNHEIYIMSADGSEQRNLTVNSAADEHPCWSPDGSHVAFTSNRDGNFEIYTINADGSGVKNLTRHVADDWGPSWSPDGSRIAFMSWRDGNNEIYVIQADGREQVRLTNSATEDRWPSWSPSGGQIVFMSNRDGNWEVYSMNAEGGEQVNLTKNPADDSYPSWSPDGSRIAFTSNRDGNDEVYLISASGSEVMNLTRNSADDWAPSWSSNGECVAFVSDRDGNDEIYIINTDGSGQTRVTNDPPSDDWDPSW
jgi:Tol biopolymer transport system component